MIYLHVYFCVCMCVVLWVMSRLSLVDNAIVGICDPTFTKPLKGFSPEAWVGKSGNKATASKHHACWRGVHGFSGRMGVHRGPEGGETAHSPVGL